jgi:uncharacterized protein
VCDIRTPHVVRGYNSAPLVDHPAFPPPDDPGAPPPLPPSPDGTRPRLVALAEVLLCSSVPTQLIIGGLLRAAGMPVPVEGQPLPLSFVLALGLLDTGVLIVLMVVLTRAHGERVRDLWLGPRPAGHEAMVGLLLVPVVFLLVIVLLSLVHVLAPWLRTVPENPLEQLATVSTLHAVALAGLAIVAGGVREELQRAFVLVRFERHLGGPVVGVVVVSTAFGLLHAVQGADAMLVTGMLGAFWAIVYLRRRSVVAPLVSHAGFNALQILRVVALR